MSIEWDKYKDEESEVEAWQAVALSLDLRPIFPGNNASIQNLFSLHPDFETRLNKTREELGANVQRNSSRDPQGIMFPIKLKYFGVYARSKGWKVPERLPGKLNKERWLQKSIWRPENFKFILLNLEPYPGIPSTQSLNEAIQEIDDAISIGAERGGLKNNLPTPSECIEWALTKKTLFPNFPYKNEDIQKPANLPISSNKWPWGDYETELLNILAEAIQEFCVHRDAAEYPKKETGEVISWLKKRKANGTSVSENIAKVIESIISPRPYTHQRQKKVEGKK